jgi:adenosylhomocysteine nucleosidase
MSRIAVVAALEREVSPLIQNWKIRSCEYNGRLYKFFENQDAVLVCGGIGPEAARRATEAIVQEFEPSLIVSVGFAGALDAKLRVGDVIEPRTVIDAKDGSRVDTGSGEGILVTYSSVAGREQKEKLRTSFGAAAVDMEAASVARGAQSRDVEFGALKVVSDDSSFDMPAMEGFIGPDGSFRSAKFGFHVAVRPWLWVSTIALASNSARASRALSEALQGFLVRVAAMTPKGGTS